MKFSACAFQTDFFFQISILRDLL